MKARLIATACVAGTVATLFSAGAQASRLPPVPSPCPVPSPIVPAPKPSLVTPGHVCIQPIPAPNHTP